MAVKPNFSNQIPISELDFLRSLWCSQLFPQLEAATQKGALMKKFLPLAVITLLAFNAHAQGTAFTYQGRLNDSGGSANGSYDFRVRLASDAVGNNFVTGPLLTNGVPVSGGLFTLMLDFGAGIFTGSNYWLQVDVKTNNAVSYTTLTPLQAVTPAPYAIFANTASNLSGTLASAQLSGALPSTQLSGTYSGAVTFSNAANSLSGNFNGNGGALTNVNAVTLGGLSAANFWKTNGNTGANPTNGAFIGNADNLPFEVRVNNHRAFRLEPDSSGFYPNVIGGSEGNSIAAGLNSTTIGGGSGNNVVLTGDPFAASSSVIGGGAANLIGGTPGSGTIAFGGCNFIGGGLVNNIRAGADFDTISGGADNLISTNSDYDTIAGGQLNAVSSDSFSDVIGGGYKNIIGTNAISCTIGGGNSNTVANNSSFASIPGGDSNVATNYAFAAGRRAKANHDGAFVWADSQNADFASTGANQFLIRASGGVGIGTASPTRELEVQNAGDTEIGIKSTDAGGHLWTLQSSSATSGASFQVIDRTLGGSRLFINTNGNVGIGTSSPTNKLHVNGGITCTALVQTSDRNVKENFAAISPQEILARVTVLPISSWNFKEMRDGRHLGPMAQDFYAAFHVGPDDKHIATVDADGVALAAIQGLNQKVEEKDARIAELERRLEKLERLIDRENGGER